MFDEARRVFASLAFLLAIALSTLPICEAEDAGPDHPIVAGFERFHADPSSDPVRGGLLLLGELNCTSCHRAGEAAEVLIAKKQAPILDSVGGRIKLDAIRKLLADPHGFKPGTTMPDILGQLDGHAKTDAVENLAHFLATTGRATESPPERRAIAQGKKYFEEVGCVACHGLRDGGTPLPTSVPLGDLSAKYTVASLAGFLREPHKVRPSGRMPSLNLEAGEARAIAHYLLKDLAADLKPNLAFSCYEGDWDEVPDFSGLEPKKSGTSVGFDLGNASRTNDFAMRFEGYLGIEREGRYAFHVTSDDGAKLWIDGKEIVSNDGLHPAQTATGRARLAAGSHKIVVGYFDGGHQRELDVEIEGRDLPRRSIEASLSLTEMPKAPEPKDEAPGFAIAPEKAEKGRALFTSLGCASCHQLAKEGKPLESSLAAAPLEGLRPGSGCLAPRPSPKSPRYALNERQRTTLGAALEALAAKPADPSDKAAIGRTMTAFNCYACHSRDGVGGVEDSRRELFATTYQDLGDEGRLPPHLNGVGGKLTAEWLRHILDDGAKDRPYMLARMPKFGGGNVGGLAEKFASADAIAASPDPAFDLPPKRIKGVGRHLVGTQAFGCVQCHNFRGIKSTGVPALDMSLMTKRLRREWFKNYVADPQAYRPGTRMPSAWPKEESQLADVLDGSSGKQIDAVWLYLSDGNNAQPPYGIGQSPVPLVAEGEAVIYRAFIAGAGTRGIGVGYPEKANLAFDANDGRIALIWQGGFMDASKHWVGRGDGFQPPMGDNVVKFPDGSSLAALKDGDEPWPKAPPKENGFRFRGYKLGKDRRPTFLYDLGPARVEDVPEAIAGKDVPALRRTLTLTTGGDGPNLWYRAAVGSKIVETSGGWYSIDGEWNTRLESREKPILRRSDGKAELLLPIKFEGGQARISQDYQW